MTRPDEEYELLDEPVDAPLGAVDETLGILEAPDADAAEQRVPVNPADRQVRPHRAFEANEYDALEQAHVIDLDDDYR